MVIVSRGSITVGSHSTEGGTVPLLHAGVECYRLCICLPSIPTFSWIAQASQIYACLHSEGYVDDDNIYMIGKYLLISKQLTNVFIQMGTGYLILKQRLAKTAFVFVIHSWQKTLLYSPYLFTLPLLIIRPTKCPHLSSLGSMAQTQRCYWKKQRKFLTLSL